MKDYKLFFEFYPFNVENMNPKSETVNANSLEEAFTKLEEMKGKGSIEIFKAPARKHYNE
jgi:hypothetical protein